MSKGKARMRGYLNAQQAAARKSRDGEDIPTQVEIDEIIRLMTYLRPDFKPPSDQEESREYLEGWQDALSKTKRPVQSGSVQDN